ncbi:MAG: homocysteine S-methyltransferase, partial [Actinomycetota bacterium]|nr:homocysteine S-methyltransferase [Actinomycetota bacterium]
PLLVAASVGPYGAVLADGSEYRGRYGLSAAQLRDFHLPRLETLAAAGPDLFAVETIPDVEEAEVLVPLLDEVGIPSWFSYAVQGTATRAGQALDDAFAVLRDSSAVQAAGVNCSAPHDVLGAVRAATAVTGRPGVAYPNKGEEWDSSTNTWRGTGEYAAALATEWVAAGARLVGGCCRVGPAEIAGLAEQLAPRA